MVKAVTKLTTVSDAIRSLKDVSQPVSRKVLVNLENADMRVLSADVMAPRDVPHFNMSFMDGFALRSADVATAGKILAPAGAEQGGKGFCLQVRTGGAVPEWADAVVRLEDVEVTPEGILIEGIVEAGNTILPRGRTIKQGDLVLPEGTWLRPTDVATLARLGLTRVEVYDRPRVLIIPTGDEVIPRGIEPGPGIVNDCNGMLCYQLAKHHGSNPTFHSIVGDDVPALAAALKDGLAYDLVVTTGGVSIGPRDNIAEALNSAGSVLVHGVKIRPGRPMGTGFVEGDGKRVPAVFLPGTLESCAITALNFIEPIVKYLGHFEEPPKRDGKVTLTAGIGKFPGARALVKVRIDGDRATPVSLIGDAYPKGEYAYVFVPENVDRYREGDLVDLVYPEN